MAKRREIRECDFAFKCPKQWENLRGGDDPDKRYCETCERDVHFVSSRIEFEVALKLGRCVAAEVDDERGRGITIHGGAQKPDTGNLVFLGDAASGVDETIVAILNQQKKDRRAKKRDEKESQ
jgi:hypothetical protein